MHYYTGTTETMDHEIVIVGAGISGIGAAIMLNKKGINDILILEKSNDIGGCWRDNKYPGLAVDIPSFAYQYSFEPNPRWSRMYAKGGEIHQYIHHCATKYDLNKNIRHNSVVDKIVFNKKDNTWTTYLTDQTVLVSRFVIAATGILHKKVIPKINGQDTFKGESRHTVDWDNTFDIKNKKVGIIGTGATAVQLVPAIAPDVKHLTVFQRTPIWLTPKLDYVFKEEKIKEWVNNPKKYNRKRFKIELLMQIATWALTHHKLLKPFWKRFSEIPTKKNLYHQVKDPVLRKKLTPNYIMGCKRPAISSDYFKTFNRENVSLITEGIDRIYENGILTKDGKEVSLDVIVYSTGFQATEKGNFPNFKVFGTGVDELSDFWEKNKYQSFLGVSVPNYPNFFLTSGPYTFSLNWFTMLEDNVHFIIRVILEAKKEKATIIDLEEKNYIKYFKNLQKKAQNSIQVSSLCATSNTYYVDKNGESTIVAPFTPFYRWFKVRFTNLKAYNFK